MSESPKDRSIPLEGSVHVFPNIGGFFVDWKGYDYRFVGKNPCVRAEIFLDSLREGSISEDQLSTMDRIPIQKE